MSDANWFDQAKAILPLSRMSGIKATFLRDAGSVVQFPFVTYSQVTLEKLGTPNTSSQESFMRTMFVFRVASVVAATFLLGCAPTPPEDTGELTVEAMEASAYAKGVPGGIEQRAVVMTATVESIDYKARRVTLVDEAGNRKTLTAPEEAINFNEVEKGDRVSIAYVEELVIYLKEKGSPRTESGAVLLAGRAEEGNKPLVVIGGAVEISAIVKALDLVDHTATLQFPDGSERTIQVREDVELSGSQLGQEVIFQTSEAMILTVEKQ